MQKSFETANEAKTAIHSLTESLWIYSALYALLAAGAFHETTSYSMQELAAQVNMPIGVVEQLINLLCLSGFLSYTNDSVQLASGLQDHIHHVGIERFKATLCVSQRLSSAFIESARDHTLTLGWHYTDELILQSQGLYSQYIITDCFAQVSELQYLLKKPNAVLLDVGAGVGQIAIRACDEYPLLKVIAVEPADAPYKLAQHNIHTSPHGNRIELRKCQIQDMHDNHIADAAWFPHVFIPDAQIPACFSRLRQALKPGGILITNALNSKSMNQSASVKRLINALHGGLRTSESVVSALYAAGFSDTTTYPEIAGYETITAISN